MIRLQDVIAMNPKVVEFMVVAHPQKTILVIVDQEEQQTVFGEEEFELSKEDIKFLSAQVEVLFSLLQ